MKSTSINQVGFTGMDNSERHAHWIERLSVAAKGDPVAKEKEKEVLQRMEEQEYYSPPVKTWPWIKAA
jgi:hypothetical protein